MESKVTKEQLTGMDYEHLLQVAVDPALESTIQETLDDLNVVTDSGMLDKLESALDLPHDKRRGVPIKCIEILEGASLIPKSLLPEKLTPEERNTRAQARNLFRNLYHYLRIIADNKLPRKSGDLGPGNLHHGMIVGFPDPRRNLREIAEQNPEELPYLIGTDLHRLFCKNTGGVSSMAPFMQPTEQIAILQDYFSVSGLPLQAHVPLLSRIRTVFSMPGMEGRKEFLNALDTFLKTIKQYG